MLGFFVVVSFGSFLGVDFLGGGGRTSGFVVWRFVFYGGCLCVFYSVVFLES